MLAIKFEDIFPNNTPFESRLLFKPGSLSLKFNEHGIRGLHAETDFSENETVLTTNKAGGCFNHFRAYEEARDHLPSLGVERYTIPEKLMIVIGAYFLYKRSPAKFKQSFYLNTDSILSAADTYLNGYLFTSPEFFNDFNPNIKNEYEEVKKTSEILKKLNINEKIFRGIYSLLMSRTWKSYGAIPGFDLMNSKFGMGSNNIKFLDAGETFSFVATRDISKGEELTWQYNSSDAIGTFAGYGYMDRSRIYSASVNLVFSGEEKQNYVKLMSGIFKFPKSTYLIDRVYDPFNIELFLSSFGPETSETERRFYLPILAARFHVAKSKFRIKSILQGELDEYKGGFTDLDKPSIPFDLRLEVKALKFFLEAIHDSQSALANKMKGFRDKYTSLDLTDLYEINNTCLDEWKRVVRLFIKLHEVDDLSSILERVNEELGLSLNSSNVRDSLSDKEGVPVSLVKHLILENLRCRDLI